MRPVTVEKTSKDVKLLELATIPIIAIPAALGAWFTLEWFTWGAWSGKPAPILGIALLLLAGIVRIAVLAVKWWQHE